LKSCINNLGTIGLLCCSRYNKGLIISQRSQTREESEQLLVKCGNDVPFFDRRLLCGYTGTTKDFSDTPGWVSVRKDIVVAITQSFACLNNERDNRVKSME